MGISRSSVPDPRSFFHLRPPQPNRQKSIAKATRSSKTRRVSIIITSKKNSRPHPSTQTFPSLLTFACIFLNASLCAPCNCPLLIAASIKLSLWLLSRRFFSRAYSSRRCESSIACLAESSTTAGDGPCWSDCRHCVSRATCCALLTVDVRLG